MTSLALMPVLRQSLMLVKVRASITVSKAMEVLVSLKEAAVVERKSPSASGSRAWRMSFVACSSRGCRSNEDREY